MHVGGRGHAGRPTLVKYQKLERRYRYVFRRGKRIASASKVTLMNKKSKLQKTNKIQKMLYQDG